jgi:hypothetical protein
MKFSELDILDIGNTIQISGLVISGPTADYVLPLPGESIQAPCAVEMTTKDWEEFFHQSDVQNVTQCIGETKLVVRKSQRIVDAKISWEVFKRDGYRCRYCGNDGPLSVDHIITWETGGPTRVENLLASCKKCNRTRGNMPYEQWIMSDYYQRIASAHAHDSNVELSKQLPHLETLRVKVMRSR